MQKSKLKNKGSITIVTERLVLRKFNASDYKDCIKNFLADENSYKFIGGKPIKNKVSAYFICLGYKYKSKILSNYFWAIEFNGEVIGKISSNYISKRNNECNIGYTIGSKFWNKGFATEATKAVINFFFEEVGVNKICANCYDENIGSAKVMEKSGMTKEGTFSDHYYKNDRFYDGYLFAITKSKKDNGMNNALLSDCTFCNICRHEITSNIVHESDTIIAVLDIDPINEGHILIIPKIHTDSLINISSTIINEMFQLTKIIIPIYKELYNTDSYTIMQNGGACCDFGHFHLHIFPRVSNDEFGWKCNEKRKFDDLLTVLDKIKKQM